MENYTGRLVSHEVGEQISATVNVDGDWVRIWNDHRRVGAWPIADVNCERITVFRFQLTLDGVIHTFSPDDPGGFAEGIGAVIDLRPKSRFGLGPRVKAAKEEQAARRAREAEASSAG